MKYFIILVVFIISLSAVSLEKNRESIVQLKVTTIANTEDFGSAIIVDKNKLVTAYHVIDEALEIVAIDSVGNNYKTTVTKVSVKDDLAYLEIKDTTLPISELEEEIKWSEPVYTLSGNGTLLKGIISKKEENCILLNFAVPAGNSGGGVFNKKGKLIAIISSTYLEEGVSYAVRVNSFKNITESFSNKKAINLKSNNYDYSFCSEPDTLKTWAKIIKSGDMKANTLHAIFLGLCEKVKRKDMTTEEADYVLMKNRKRLFGI